MKGLAMAMVLLLLVGIAPGSGLTIRDFPGGARSVFATLNGTGQIAAADLSICPETRVLNASLRVQGLPDEGGSWPSGVSVLLDDILIWDFNGTGAGALGRQEVFSDGSREKELSLTGAGDLAETRFRLPAEAAVRNATLKVHFRGGDGPLLLACWTGGADSEYLGKAVAPAGDLNGDGFDDFLIGLPRNDTTAFDSGAAQLFLGGPKPPAEPFITLYGEGFNDNFGSALSGAGDLNGDGYDDIIVGAPWNSSGAYIGGRAYVYFGGPSMDNRPDLNFTGTAPVDYLGMSVSGAGDANGDGYADLIVGAPGVDTANGKDSGAAYLYFGGPAMDNVSDVTFLGAGPGDSFGWSVSAAGDVNGDGFGDVVVGAYYNDWGGTDAGRAYVFFGGKDMDSVSDIQLSGAADYDMFGYSVSGAGDVNGDGYDDLIVGAARNDSNGAESGRAYIYFGGQAPDGAADIVLDGAAAGDFFGIKVSGAGDVNGDGCDDVLVGAPWTGTAGTWFGSAYVFYGGRAMDSLPDLTFNGNEYWEDYGFSLSSAGDTNADGYCDFLIGAFASDEGATDAGRAELYSAAPFLLGPAVEVAGRGVWNSSSFAAGNRTIGNLAPLLNAFLAGAAPAGNFGSGNDYVEVPVRVTARDAGTVTLGLEIVYDYSAAVPDFAARLNGYIADHQNSSGGPGNLTIPLRVSSSSAGRVQLSEPEISLDEPPVLVRPLPAVVIDEDTCVPAALDLYDFFQDDFDAPPRLDFSVLSATEPERVAVGISDRHYLSVNARDGDANDNWTGTLQVRLGCSDRWGLLGVSNLFDVVVRNVNDPPFITSAPPDEATAGLQYEYRPEAVDGDGDLLRFSADPLPPGMTVDPATGRILWTPSGGGNFSVSLSVSDGSLGTFQNFTLFVRVLNKAPRFVSVPPVTATALVPFVYEARAVDTDGDPLEYSLSSWPGGMSVSAATGRIEWTPPPGSGNLTVVVEVTDGKGGRARQDFTIEVLPYQGPKISIAFPAAGKTVSGSIIVSGTVVRGTREVSGVELRIDSGHWQNASGNSSWGLRLDTTRLSDGEHLLEVLASDGFVTSDVASVRFWVANQGEQPGWLSYLVLAAALAALGASGAAVYLWARRRRPGRRTYDWGPD